MEKKERFSEVEVVYDWPDIPAMSALDSRMQSVNLGTLLTVEVIYFKFCLYEISLKVTCFGGGRGTTPNFLHVFLHCICLDLKEYLGKQVLGM